MSSPDANVPEPDEERPAGVEGQDELPAHLDAPLEAPEADVVEQTLEVPPAEDEG